MQDRPAQVNNNDNGFIKQKELTRLASKCKAVLEKSPQLKRFHFRIPICIGYTEDLTPLQFQTFVEQIQDIVGRFSYTYTFYLAPNEDPAAGEKIAAWMRDNKTLIDSLSKTKNLVDLCVWRQEKCWTDAYEKYNGIINSEDYATKEKKPIDWLQDDAKKFQDGCKKRQQIPLSFAELVGIAKKKAVDMLSWAVLGDSKCDEASIIIHYASPSNAMINLLQQIEKLGYVKYSCAYLDFKPNKNIKKLGVEPMPQTGQQKQSEKKRPISQPVAIMSANSSYYSSGEETWSTGTTLSDPVNDWNLVLDLYTGLTHRGLDPQTSAVGVAALLRQFGHNVGIRKHASLNKSGSHSAPASPPAETHGTSEPSGDLQTPGTLFHSSRERAASQPSSPPPILTIPSPN